MQNNSSKRREKGGKEKWEKSSRQNGKRFY